MKTRLLILLGVFAMTTAKAEIVHVSSDITLGGAEPNFTTVVIEGKNVNLSHWGFEASGFQIDGNNDFVGLVIEGGSENLMRLNEGDPISTSEDFVTPSGYAPAYHSPIFGTPEDEILTNDESTYFGFKVIDGANTYYAWLKLTRISSDEVVINEYAYENEEGVAISAGDNGAGGGGDVSVTSDVTEHFTVYPNPVYNHLFFKGNLEGWNEVSIIDLAGKVVIRSNDISSGIAVQTLNTGFYIVKIRTNSGAILIDKIEKK
ncbi:MAG: hypothetical protein ACI8ZM_002338 [Crocinitomix sp.]|jgi:hypothetical protein